MIKQIEFSVYIEIIAVRRPRCQCKCFMTSCLVLVWGVQALLPRTKILLEHLFGYLGFTPYHKGVISEVSPKRKQNRNNFVQTFRLSYHHISFQSDSSVVGALLSFHATQEFIIGTIS